MQGDREERAKQREMMKEMRARREAEKAVESKFREEVQQQRAKVKEKEVCNVIVMITNHLIKYIKL